MGDQLEEKGKEVGIVEKVVEVDKREVVEKRWEAEETRRWGEVERRLVAEESTLEEVENMWEVVGSKSGEVERRPAEEVN